jgi:anthranilate synthase component 1
MIKNIYPNFDEFRKLAKKGNLIPVYKEILADLETPVSTYLKLAGDEKHSYLLESVEGGERWGRYSFIAWEPKYIFQSRGESYSLNKPGEKAVWKASPNPLANLKELMNSFIPVEIKGLPRFWGGAVGYVSYDMVRFFERLTQKPKDTLKVPDCVFMITDKMVIFDHLSHTLKIAVCVNTSGKKNLAGVYKEAERTIGEIEKKIQKPLKAAPVRKFKSGPISSNIEKKDFLKKVERAKHYIRLGDIIQVVPSQRFSRKTKAESFDIYRALRLINPSPYMYYLRNDGFDIIGSSPEILVRKEDALAQLRPIAGTRPRGKSEAEEASLQSELLADPKETAEHIMLVDLGRNDLARVCKPHTVRVPHLMVIEKYSHVMHIVSSVEGELKPGMDSYELFRACFPAGTVSGAPKVRAMEIIDELEPEARGVYAGAVGYFSFSDNMDMAIAIRTIVLKDGVAYAQAGGGVVADSVPENEYTETKNKAAALFAAIDMAEKGLEA